MSTNIFSTTQLREKCRPTFFQPLDSKKMLTNIFPPTRPKKCRSTFFRPLDQKMLVNIFFGQHINCVESLKSYVKGLRITTCNSHWPNISKIKKRDLYWCICTLPRIKRWNVQDWESGYKAACSYGKSPSVVLAPASPFSNHESSLGKGTIQSSSAGRHYPNTNPRYNHPNTSGTCSLTRFQLHSLSATKTLQRTGRELDFLRMKEWGNWRNWGIENVPRVT